MEDRPLPPVDGCRLLRADGSAWTVTGLRRTEGRIEVDARRDFDPVEEDVLPSRRPARLDGEPLAFGDRLVWKRRDGSLLWTTLNPVDGTLAWGVDPEPGRAGGDRDDPDGGGFFEDGLLGAV